MPKTRKLKTLSLNIADFFSKKTKVKKSIKSYPKANFKLNHNIPYTNAYKKSNVSKKNNESNENKISNILNSIYSINNPINNSLIKYNDKESKLLNKDAYNNFKISKPFTSDILNSYYDSINQINEIKKPIHKMPKPVQYATEDFTRGLRTFLNVRYHKLPIPSISNAFVKLWEVLETFDSIIKKESKTFKVFHICEAPGQMILSNKYFVEKKRPNIENKNYDWRANSLNPYNPENRAKFGKVFSDDYNMIKNNPKKWLWGEDNTGDITKVKNIKSFRKYINEEWLTGSGNGDKLDLICGDGGLSTDLEPFLLQKLDLAQAITTIVCSSKGGSCCIKHFTPFINTRKDTYNASGFFLGFLYLYYTSFEQVSLFKPYSSNPDSGEFYVVGINFLGISDMHIENLYKVLDGFKVNHAIIEKDNMPETFVIQINNFIKLMSQLNSDTNDKTNLLLTCYDNMPNAKGVKQKSGSRNRSGNGSRIDRKLYELLKCNNFLDDNNIETILVPRYNEWIKKYNFE